MPDQGRPATWQDLIRVEARAAGVPESLALGLADQESSFNPSAKGTSGEVGLFQLMPNTAKELGVDPADPFQNIKGGLRYFKQRLDANGGDVQKALGEYNAGPGRAPRTTYVQDVLGKMGRYQPQQQPTTQTTTPPPSPATTTPPPQPGLLQSIATGTLSAFDPRERSGRRNIAGAAGGIAGGLLGEGIGSAPLAIAGAAAGGGLEDALERWARGEPLNTLPGTNAASAEGSIGGAALEQGANEGLGQVAMWPLRVVGRRLLAPKVATYAAKSLEAERAGTEATLDAAVRDAEHALTTTRQSSMAARDLVKSKGQEAIDLARQSKSALEQLTQQRGEAGVQSVEQRMAAHGTTPAISPTQTGTLVHGVLTGAAKDFKSQVGAAVGEAAASGPPIPTQPLREELTRLGTSITPQLSPEGRIPVITDQAGHPFSVEQAKAILAKNPDAIGLSQIPQELHLPATMELAKDLTESGETIPFSDAHKLKILLDSVVNWDRAAKAPKEQITKAFRQTLRTAMEVHEPYNQATAAYQGVQKLYGNKSLARTLMKNAVEDPGSLVRNIRPTQPNKLAALKEILLQHAAEGGNADQGTAAWNAVRAAWTHQNIIAKGPEQLLDRIGKLDPDFVKVMYGDADGAMVLDNLKQIGTAYTNAVEKAATNIKAAKAAGSEQLRGVRSDAVRQATLTKRSTDQAIAAAQGQRTAAVEARQAARAPTDLELSFRNSSVHKAPTIEQSAADVLRATALGPTSIWGGLSIMRLLTHGVRGQELIEWASRSPKATKLVVDLLESSAGPAVTSQLVRGTGVLNKDVLSPVASHLATSGPPPQPRAIR